jgi:hydrogenase expression/formation protein HypE
LFDKVGDIHCLRDPTRGGIAAALNDIAAASHVGINIQESSLPVTQEVRGACDLLGLDVLNVANEGKMLIVCKHSEEEEIINAINTFDNTQAAVCIGRVVRELDGIVILNTLIGGSRIVEIPLGQDLPRIC